jgi:hypothetical protein
MPEAAYLQVIRRHYPTAITTVESVDRLFDTLHRRFDLVPGKIMLADSICSDDVNSIEYPKRAYEMLGPFKMGGLDGFPFTGLTGMGAFAAHVPDDGAVFVYHAPHIGIDKDGNLGQILREGQSKPSGCCGACRAALAKLQAGQIVPDDITTLDYQQNTIEQILYRAGTRITGAKQPLKEATEVMHEAITDRIDLLASKTNYNARYLILVGGILINSDADVGSFTEIRRAVVVDLRTKERDDILSDLLEGVLA